LVSIGQQSKKNEDKPAEVHMRLQQILKSEILERCDEGSIIELDE
jgi:hypothetical protein